MRRRSAASAALGVAVLALAGPAAAQAAAPGPQEEAGAGLEERLATGLEQFQDLDYREAIATLGAVRRDPAATRVQKVRALELIGISHLILDEKVPAAEAFEDLLTIDPGYQLAHDDGSPKIREFYAEVKRKVVPAGATSSPVAVRLEHTAPNEAVAGREVEIETVVRAGVEQVVVLVLRWRRRGVFDYQQAPMRRTGGDEARWRARFVPPASPGRYAVDYYLEAVNAAGGSIGRIGGPEDPLELAVAPGGPVDRGAGPRPWYRRWYVIVGGAAVVGLAAATVVLTTGGSTPDGSLGRVSLGP